MTQPKGTGSKDSDSLATHNNRTIAIIGGGPAGCATALSLRQSGVDNVCLFNSTQDNGTKIGETIPPAATPILSRLGLGHILSGPDHLPCSGSVSIWGAPQPGYNDFWFDPVGKGFHLDRNRFDQQMRFAAQDQGATWFEGWHLHSVSQQTSAYELLFKLEDGSEQTIMADFVVDASGQSASFARRLRVARNMFDEVISLSAIFCLPKNVALSNHTFVEAVENGWWYAARIPGDRMIVSFSSDLMTIKKEDLMQPEIWNQQLQNSKFLKDSLPSNVFQQMPELQVMAARSSILSNVVGEAWLAVGDAACSYDPLASAGITKAIAQGEMAGRAIAQSFEAKDDHALSEYQNKIFQQFRQYVSLRKQLYMSENRFHQQPFWKRRQLLCD